MTRLRGWVCARGCAFLEPQETCPHCGVPCRETRLSPVARLRAVTTVRVSDAGEPFQLGLAVTTGGASTLCRVDGRVRGHGYDRVRLVLRDGLYVALAAGARVITGSRERPATRAGYRRS